MKTFSAKPLEVKREWYVVDATDKVVGRLAAEIALRLRGKDKPEYTPQDVYKRQRLGVRPEKRFLSARRCLPRYPEGFLHAPGVRSSGSKAKKPEKRASSDDR